MVFRVKVNSGDEAIGFLLQHRLQKENYRGSHFNPCNSLADGNNNHSDKSISERNVSSLHLSLCNALPIYS